MTSNTTYDLYAIWGSMANNDLYASGAAGTVVRYNGSTWGVQSSGYASSIYSVWGTGGADVWLGTAGTVRRGVRGASAATYGEPSALSETISWSGNYLVAVPVTVSSTMEVASIGLISRAGAGDNINARMAVYADAGGVPGALVTQTGVFTITGSGTYLRSVTQARLEPGTYWIMHLFDNTSPMGYSSGGGGPGYRYLSYSYGSGFPGTAPGMGDATGTGYRVNYYISGFTVP
jgi:hypothetical protein